MCPDLFRFFLSKALAVTYRSRRLDGRTDSSRRDPSSRRARYTRACTSTCRRKRRRKRVLNTKTEAALLTEWTRLSVPRRELFERQTEGRASRPHYPCMPRHHSRLQAQARDKKRGQSRSATREKGSLLLRPTEEEEEEAGRRGRNAEAPNHGPWYRRCEGPHRPWRPTDRRLLPPSHTRLHPHTRARPTRVDRAEQINR